MAATYVFLFPGQGSQTPRMGQDFYNAYPVAREIFERTDGVLGRDLGALVFNGPARELERTENLQPAIAAVNAAVLAVLRAHGIEPVAVAGHSLGEYSAIHAAGVVSFDDLIGLVSERGRLMGEAAAARPGGMVAVAGLDEERLQSVVDAAGDAGTVCVANLNAPDEIVLSGDTATLEVASRLALEAGATRVAALPVSGAWHSDLMRGAMRDFAVVLDGANLGDAGIDVYSNVAARPVRTAGDLWPLLSRQICAPVRWAEVMGAMFADQPEATFIEVGPGRVLMGLGLRNDRRRRVVNVGTVRGFESFLAKS